MDKKKIKIFATIIVAVIIIAGALVAADYYELFGSKIEKRLGFSEIRFRTIDKNTGGLIMDAGVRCFQKNNMNACTRKESHQLGVVSVNVPVQRAVKRTLLFKKAEEIYRSIDPKIHIMLIHQNYYKQTITLNMDDVYSNRIDEQTVEMSPVKRVLTESERELMEENINE